MTKIVNITCVCCARSMTPNQFRRGLTVCMNCESLPVLEAIAKTKDTIERNMRGLYETAEGRKQRGRDKHIKRYEATGGKRCGACQHKKAVAEFASCKARHDGLQATCRACNKLKATVPLSSWVVVRDALRAQAAANCSTIYPPASPLANTVPA